MALIAPIIRKMQTKFELDCPRNNLKEDHLARDIVYLINQFEKEKPYLFPEKNIKRKIGPKFQNDPKKCWDCTFLQLLDCKEPVEKSNPF